MSQAVNGRNKPFYSDPTRRGFLQRKTWSEGTHEPRFKALRGYMDGKNVLDMGCSNGMTREDWLHGQISGVAERLVGLDIDEGAVAELIERGLDMRFGNAEDFDLGETFDVVFGGEMIEHLENPGGMLRSVLRHLGPDGQLVLTTPNAFAFPNFVYRIKGQARINGDHTCWYCEDTLAQLLGRVGFEVTEVKYLHYDAPGLVRGGIAKVVRKLLPERLGWSTIIVVARRADGDTGSNVRTAPVLTERGTHYL